MLDGLRAAARGFANVYQNGYSYIWANLAFVLLSLPVITAPAALSALYRVAHMAHTQPSEADLATFWETFRANLLRALPWGLFNVLFGVVNFNNLIAYSHLSSPGILVLHTIWIAAGLVWAGVLLYTWPVYYEMAEPTVTGAMRNALVMVIQNPLFTLTLLAILLLLAVISTVLIASWLLLTWGCIVSITTAAVLNRLEQFRAAHPSAN